MPLLYNSGIQLYYVAVRLAALRNTKAKLWLQGRKNWKQQLSLSLQNRKPGAKCIWVHAASLGEFEQGRPLIEALRSDYPDAFIPLTFFSPSGYEQRKSYAVANHVAYLPLDTKSNAVAFMDIVQPSLAVSIKYEYWYHFLKALALRDIPSILLSAVFRSDQIFFRSHGGMFRKLLLSFDYLLVQNAASAALLKEIAIPKEKVVISGDTRYDRVCAIASQQKPLPVIERFLAGAPAMVAGSTWPDGELLLKGVLQTLPQHYKIIIAPHEINDAHVQHLLAIFTDDAITYSAFEQTVSDKRVLIVDNIGMLSALYRYAEFAYIGGGFNKSGIHNTLEATAYGIPVVFGPYYKKFAEAIALLDLKHAFSVSDIGSITNIFTRLLQRNEAEKEHQRQSILAFMQQNRGATNIALQKAKALLGS